MKKSFHRRDLLRLGSAALLFAGASSTLPSARRRALFPASPLNPAKKLLFIFQRGGNDAVNTVVPIGDMAEYAALRPTIGLAAGQVTSLNGFAALSNSMAKVLPIYNAGRLAVVHQTGYSGHSRSHFDSMRNIETTVHDMPGFLDGFVPRMAQVLDPTGANPLFGVSVSNQLQTAFSGTPTLPVLQTIGSYKLDPNPSPSQDYVKLLGGPGGGITAAYAQPAVPGHAHDPLVRDTGNSLIGSLNTVAGLPPYAPATAWTAAGYPYPTSPGQAQQEGLAGNGVELAFFQKLRDAMQLLTDTSTCTQVAGVEIGAWDTHTNQLYEQDYLLRALAHGIRAAREDALLYNVWNDLVIWVVTEFGRTSGENASGGTDHGNAFVSFVAGGAVNGGVVNCDASTWATGPTGALHGVTIPSGPTFLTHRTDYRVILYEILSSHFGITSQLDIDLIIDNYTAISQGDPLFNPINVV